MKVRERKYSSGRKGWQVDVSGVTDAGEPYRARLQVPENVTSKLGATRWAEEQRRRIERGEVPASPRAAKRAKRERTEQEREEAKVDALQATTVAEAVRWYLEDGETERLAPTTLDLRERISRDHICSVEVDGARLGERQVRQLGAADAKAVARRAAALSPGFARLIMRTLRGVVDAARERKVECDLVVQLPKAPVEEEPRAYDPGSYERLVTAATRLTPHHLAVVLLSGEAGMRRGEILGLTVADALLAIELRAIKIERQVVRVRGVDIVRPPKHGRSRAVPLSDRCADLLRKLTPGRAPEARLVLASDGETPATENTVRAYMYRAQRHAGLPEVGPHAARHTALSHMLASGSDLKVVQTIAGHKHVQTTARYLHAMPDAVARAGAKVEQWRQSAAVTSTSLAPVPRPRARIKPSNDA